VTDAQVQRVDQFILRFTKLQDAMGCRLFPAILQYLQEPYEERPMLDKLNRLEKRNYSPYLMLMFASVMSKASFELR